jgi:hypothetical protein
MSSLNIFQNFPVPGPPKEYFNLSHMFMVKTTMIFESVFLGW